MEGAHTPSLDLSFPVPSLLAGPCQALPHLASTLILFPERERGVGVW